ncbi:hypothetical protein AB0C51_09625 [Streptomyces pathocidini]
MTWAPSALGFLKPRVKDRDGVGTGGANVSASARRGVVGAGVAEWG